MDDKRIIGPTGAVGQVDATAVPRFAGEATFARLPRARDVGDLAVAIVGMPFDTGVSFRPGARFGPSHVRQSSRLLRGFNPEVGTLPFEVHQVADCGDVAINPFDIAEAISQIENAADALWERADRLASIGGDHTIALPILRAAARKVGGPVAVVHFDAHLDTWDSYFGADYTHGTPFRRASEEQLIDREASLHVGVRGPLYSPRDLPDDDRLGFRRVTSMDVLDWGYAGVVQAIRERVQDRPVYLSVDIDVLDPGMAPGTGTPEAGGMTSRELLAILRGMGDLDLVGCDVVEVSPAYDHAEITGVAAAHVIYEVLSGWARTR